MDLRSHKRVARTPCTLNVPRTNRFSPIVLTAWGTRWV